MNNGQCVGSTKQQSYISHLAASLWIEWGLIKNNLAFVIFIQRLNFITFNQRYDLRISDSRRFITIKDRLWHTPGDISVNWIGLRLCLTLVSRCSLLKLL